ncbi:MAG: molybdopterin converting factor small subunit [Saprospiraceae bacterium]|jgi:molybdopterin converting factor small subunit
MKLNLIAYGIAREILGESEMQLEITTAPNIGALKKQLVDMFPNFEKLVRFSMAVNEEYREEDFLLSDGDEVVIIPPVSGG